MTPPDASADECCQYTPNAVPCGIPQADHHLRATDHAFVPPTLERERVACRYHFEYVEECSSCVPQPDADAAFEASGATLPVPTDTVYRQYYDSGWDARARHSAERIAALEAALRDLELWTDSNSGSLPTYQACECGGDPHDSRPCGKGTCDCQEYRLRDADGHELRRRVRAALQDV